MDTVPEEVIASTAGDLPGSMNPTVARESGFGVASGREVVC